MVHASMCCLSQLLRLLRVLGAGNAEASDQMSDMLTQVPPPPPRGMPMLAIFNFA